MSDQSDNRFYREKPKHGGSRPNSGRKPGPQTKIISFRVKLDQIGPVRELVRKYLGK